MIIMTGQILLRADSSMINVTIADEGTAAHVACEKGHAEVSPMPSRRYLGDISAISLRSLGDISAIHC